MLRRTPGQFERGPDPVGVQQKHETGRKDAIPHLGYGKSHMQKRAHVGQGMQMSGVVQVRGLRRRVNAERDKGWASGGTRGSDRGDGPGSHRPG